MAVVIPAKNAAYGINSFISSLMKANNISLPLYPGRFAPENVADIFGTYKIRPYTDFEYWMVHTDKIDYHIYSTSFDQLQDIMNIFLLFFNVENIGNNKELFEPGIKYMATNAVVDETDENVFIEGHDYYYAKIDIMVVYSITGPEPQYSLAQLAYLTA